MKKSFAARRTPRKIGEEIDNDGDTVIEATDPDLSNEQVFEPVVKRSQLSSRPKKPSSLRLSFGPGGAEPTSQSKDSEDGSVFAPQKSALSRRAIERNAERKALAASISADRLPYRDSPAEERPSYSKNYLQELKSSTPSTPKELGSVSTTYDEATERSLDIASKFGPLARLAERDDPAILTDAEIREKKERRARLAKEQEFMSLNADNSDDEDGQLSLRPKEKYAETRLVPDDEDVAEGFDDFVEDGKISLGRKAEKEQERRRKAQMQEMIDEAEGEASDETDESEAERKAAYDAAQTRKGTYGSRDVDERRRTERPRTPPKITPIPELGQVLARLRAALGQMENAKVTKVKTMEGLRAEKAEIVAEEVRIQQLLKETGERYEKLRAETGLGGGGGLNGGMSEGGRMVVSRGLESFGNTPIAALSDASDE